MFTKEILVRCESGLHNKQATYFVQKANEFNSMIWLESGSRKMNAKSLLGIMSLGIVTGTQRGCVNTCHLLHIEQEHGGFQSAKAVYSGIVNGKFLLINWLHDYD